VVGVDDVVEGGEEGEEGGGEVVFGGCWEAGCGELKWVSAVVGLVVMGVVVGEVKDIRCHPVDFSLRCLEIVSSCVYIKVAWL